MATKDEILTDFLAQHEALGKQADAPDLDEFNKRHRKVWGKCNEELTKRMLKLEAQETLTPDEQKELDELHAMLRWP